MLRYTILALALFSSHCAPVEQTTQESVATLSRDPSPQETPDSAEASRPAMALGMNLLDLHPRDTTVAFWDVFKQSSRWFPWNGDPSFGLRKKERQGLRGRKPPATDEHGWPMLSEGQAVFTRIFEGTGGHFPGGEYLCTWRGEGHIEFAGDARLGKVEEVEDDEGILHRATVNVRPGRVGIALVLKGDDDPDYIRDLHLFAPGYSPDKGLFYDTFLERIQPFGVLRFMNWGATYTNRGVWAERSRVEDCRQTGAYGVAIELMIELCNLTDSDPWFCMPHLAEDEYVRNFAQLVREQLEPGRTVYVEYSNECWNGIFPEAKWVNQRAREDGVKAVEIVAQETSRDFEIWSEVLAPVGDEEDVPLRLVRVIGGSLHNPGFARGVMGAMSTGFDAVAVAPYFGVRPDKDPVGRDSSAAELLRVARENIDAHLVPRLREHAQLAQAATRRLGAPVSLLSYEGGQTLTARRSTRPGDTRLAFPERTIAEAQHSRAMYEAYQHLLERCQEVDMQLFVAFGLCGTLTSASSFGVLEWIDQPIEQSPKYRALVDWIGTDR